MFEMEKAWWHYEDHIVGQIGCLPTKFEQFCRRIFKECDYLQNQQDECDKVRFKFETLYFFICNCFLVNSRLLPAQSIDTIMRCYPGR